MNQVVGILMKRDGLTEEEAKHQLANTKAMIEDAVAGGDYECAEDILASELGLEMDYIVDILM